MKKTTLLLVSLALFGTVFVGVAFAAAPVNLQNGGLGQAATNPNQFGLAVCNKGLAGITQSVPVSVSANGATVTVSSAGSIAAGACEYTYVQYSALNLQGGQTYTVNVAIDPSHTVIANSNNTASYSVAVPGGAISANGTSNAGGTADVSAQSSNIFVAFWNWLVHLF